MAGTQLDADTIADLCKDKDRRIVLAVLADQQHSLTLDDLAKAIVEHNDAISAEETSDETVTRLKTPLYHCHIPKLADAGLVSFDTSQELVEPEAGLEQIKPYLGSDLDDTAASAPCR